ncbi:MAG: MFS transporter, partial [Candidatus Paceibacterota bacterium]
MAKQIIHRYLALVALVGMFGTGIGSATYVLFLKSHGLDLFEVNLVNVAFFTTLFICEIPTGAFADVFGRKPSFIISCFLYALGLGAYAFSQSFWGFVMAEMVLAVGATFSSGAFSAWLVDSLKHHGHAEPLAPIFSKAGAIGRLGSMAGGLIGAVIAEWDLALPWFVGSIGMFIVAGYSLIVLREDYFVKQKLNWREGWQAFIRTVKTSFHYSRNNRAIRFVLIIMALQ